MVRLNQPIQFLVLLLAAGCGHGQQLRPDKSAQVILGADMAAVSVVAGVRCSANGDSWHGLPRDLGSQVTPIKVRIKNNSGAPIQLLYERFALIGASGRRYLPIPVIPWSQGANDGRLLRPIYAAEKFFIAPRIAHLYPTLPAWPNQLPRSEAYYRVTYQKWGDEPPTFDMLKEGLPEGVLENGGTVSGFLYFDGQARRKEEKVLFQAELSEADRERQIAQIVIPFHFE